MQGNLARTLSEVELPQLETQCSDAATIHQQTCAHRTRVKLGDDSRLLDEEGDGEVIVVQSIRAGTAWGAPQLYTPARLYSDLDVIVI